MIVAGLLLLGCWTYSVLSISAAVRYRQGHSRQATQDSDSGISILKPLTGVDDELEANLRSYFEQDYSPLELLFAVRDLGDPAAALTRRLQGEYPNVKSRLIETGEPPYPHDKVYKLQSLLMLAGYELIAMSDSDVRVDKDFCRLIARELGSGDLDLATCPYRAVAGPSFWSQLEAVQMNNDFHGGLFTAVMLEGANFAVGPTIVARKQTLLELGGLEAFKDYLSSEDFMLGRTAAERGYRVGMSQYIVEHRIGSETIKPNFAHRLRWARTSRRSRPWGYVGQIFTLPAFAFICIFFTGKYWPSCMLITATFRVLTAIAVSQRTLRSSIPWLLLPAADILTFGFWIAGFFGKTVHWRGQRYVLRRDGTLQATN